MEYTLETVIAAALTGVIVFVSAWCIKHWPATETEYERWEAAATLKTEKRAAADAAAAQTKALVDAQAKTMNGAK